MFEAIFNQSPVPCAILVQTRLLSRCNDAFARLLGYRRAELLGLPLHQLMVEATDLVSTGGRGGESRVLCFKHKNGQRLTLHGTAVPIISAGPEPAGTIILQITDIPIHHANSTHLASRSSTTLADLAIDYIQEAVYLIGDHGRILDANQAACDILGYSREELMQLSVSDIDPQFNCTSDCVEAVDSPRQSTPILDTVHRRKNGEIFPVKISSVDVQRGGNTYTLAFALDLSEEKRAEEMRLGILESLARGDSHLESLQRIVNYVEALHPEAIASIMLVNEAGTHLVPGPSNKLPSWYLDAIRSIPIGIGHGACGTAAATKQAVQVEDISVDPLFENWRSIVLDAGLLSCWSDPILGPDGELLGTFCIYMATTGQPSEVGIKMIAHRAGHFAAIALKRRRDEQHLRQSQQRYRDIFDNSLDALALLEVTEDRHFRTLAVNPAMERMVGIPREGMVGKRVDETVPPDVAAKTTAKYQACLDNGGVIERELELELPVGKRTFNSTLIPVRGPVGAFHRVVVITRDVTEHRKAEHLLHAREQEFRALVEHSPDGIIRYDCRGNPSYVNPAMKRIIGSVRGGIHGSWMLRQDVEDYEQALKSALLSGSESRLMVRWAGTDGRVRYGDVHFVPEFSPQGDVCSVLTVNRDVTSLKETAIQLRTLVENTPNFIARYSPDGTCIYENPSLQRWRKKGSFKSIEPGCPSAVKLVDSGLQEAIRKDAQVEREIYFPNRQEWHHIQYVPEKDELGRTMSVLAVGTDITRPKAIDIELRESRCLLRELGTRREAELEAERKRIAHEIHDELGQLLTALRMNVSLVRTQLKPGNEGPRERLSDITKLVDQTIQAVRNISTSLRPAVLNAGIVSALEWLTEEFTRHTGIQCHLDINKGVQLNEERSVVVFRVVQESLSNVGRHSQATQIRIRLHRCANAFHLTISDNGCGFDPGSKTSRQSFGLLGMRERALSLGGTLDLTSSPGSGTLLKLSIPFQ